MNFSAIRSAVLVRQWSHSIADTGAGWRACSDRVSTLPQCQAY